MTQHTRRPLRMRKHPIAPDISDAITQIVDRLDNDLPIAITKTMVIEELIAIVHTDDAGNTFDPSPITYDALFERFKNRLTNSASFQTGYKHYENVSANPVIPVTDYFFANVFADGSVADALDAMSDFEVLQSLPKRKGRVADEDADDFMRDENGELLLFGELAGIVVCPPGIQIKLQTAWMKRRANMFVGSGKSVTASIGKARPGVEAVQELQAKVSDVEETVIRALPKLPPEPSQE